MPTAITIDLPDPDPDVVIKGVVLGEGRSSRGVVLVARELQTRTVQFWGVRGESVLNGYPKGRTIVVPVLIYDEENTDFDTAAKLSTYIAQVLCTDLPGTVGDVTLTSESNWPEFEDCRLVTFQKLEGPKPDVAGTLGGSYWAIGEFTFRQLSAEATP